MIVFPMVSINELFIGLITDDWQLHYCAGLVASMCWIIYD